ncbi:MAG: FecR domain-containing protein [bacterium]
MIPPIDTSVVRYQVTQGADAAFRVASEARDRTVVELSAGTATFAVEPLPPGGIFAVETPHGRVEVVGTRFSVTVEDRCTRVDVAEGKVRVRREADAFLVPAGESRTICKGSLSGEEALRAALGDLAAGRAEAGRQRLEGYLAAEPRGLFAEDALFHLALLARREGDEAATRAAVDRFLARFPTGHRADRLRALRPAP